MAKRKTISIATPKPEGLSIYRDKSGVPHIEADDFKGAMWGDGYCHAMDRGTQLLMMRILGQGRVCELLSDNEESFAIDCFFRRANWHNNIDSQIAEMDSKSRNLAQSYCDGVNAGFTAKRLYALKLLGYQPEPWTIADSILISRMAGYLTLAQSQTEVERFFIELVQAGVPTEKLAELFPFDPKTLDRELIESVQLQERIVPNEVIWNKALPRMMASNNWVISGERTQSGKPIMANDPHLEVNRLPNVWYEKSIKWADRYVMGMGMPGLPGVIIGRSEALAWGATYTFMDTVDSWIEQCQDGQYQKDSEWHDFDVRKETIKRKKHDDEVLTFYQNDHGVLEGDPNKQGRYLATRWSPAESGAKSLMASMKMATTDTTKQAMQNLGMIESAWNWVISDTEGNIAYQMSGMMPERRANWNGFTPAPGWDSSYDWQGLVPLEELPACYNPKEGYVVTANQDLNHFGKASPINMPMGDYRAKRIEEVLASKHDHTVESTKALQLDVYSNQAKPFLDIVLPLLKQSNHHSDAAIILEKWDLKYDLESKGAPLFELFYACLREEVFGESGLGEEVIRHLSSQSGVFIDFYQDYDRAILNPDSRWHETKTRDQAFLDAFEKAQQQYQGARWKDVNRLVFVNQLFQGKLPAFLGFDSDPIPLAGGRATPNQGQIYRSNGRQTSFAPSIRMIADLADETLHTCLAGGPSDNRYSRWYKSELKSWMQGKYKAVNVDKR